MLLRINRRPLWLSSTLACLLFILFNLYLTSIYADNAKGIHFTAKPDREPDPKPKRIDEKPAAEKPRGYTVGVSVNLVMMYTSVFDKSDRFIGGLKKENFNLFEDGVRQEIASFSQEDVPISMGIILDLSGTMKNKIEQINSAARAFIQASNSQDQIFLVGFNDEVELLQEFTSDIDEITDALENAVVFGGTALYDAIYLGVEEAHKGTKSKKAIIVITDGKDEYSAYTLKELIKFAHESDVQIFCIDLVDEIPKKKLIKWSKSEIEKAYDVLERISAESGGKAYFLEDISGIHGIVSEIAAELRNQYSIGYISSNDARDGSWRRVVIKLNDKAASRIQHRSGYYAPK